jgi:hypothetical protein
MTSWSSSSTERTARGDGRGRGLGAGRGAGTRRTRRSGRGARRVGHAVVDLVQFAPRAVSGRDDGRGPTSSSERTGSRCCTGSGCDGDANDGKGPKQSNVTGLLADEMARWNLSLHSNVRRVRTHHLVLYCIHRVSATSNGTPDALQRDSAAVHVRRRGRPKTENRPPKAGPTHPARSRVLLEASNRTRGREDAAGPLPHEVGGHHLPVVESSPLDQP